MNTYQKNVVPELGAFKDNWTVCFAASAPSALTEWLRKVVLKVGEQTVIHFLSSDCIAIRHLGNTESRARTIAAISELGATLRGTVVLAEK